MPRILLVDDHPMVRTSIAGILTHDGHTVTSVEDGSKALRFLEQEAVDLVITDIVMPGVDGLELLRQMRKMEDRPPVIVFSGGGRGAQDLYIDLATHLGADATLSKPVVLDELRATVARLTGGS